MRRGRRAAADFCGGPRATALTRDRNSPLRLDATAPSSKQSCLSSGQGSGDNGAPSPSAQTTRRPRPAAASGSACRARIPASTPRLPPPAPRRPLPKGQRPVAIPARGTAPGKKLPRPGGLKARPHQTPSWRSSLRQKWVSHSSLTLQECSGSPKPHESGCPRWSSGKVGVL